VRRQSVAATALWIWWKVDGVDIVDMMD